MIGAAIAAIACGCISVNQNDGGNACRRPCIAKDIVHEKYSVEKNTVSAQDKLYGLFCFTFGSSATHEADAVCEKEGSFFEKLFPSGAAKAKNGAYANACDAAKCDQRVSGGMPLQRLPGAAKASSACRYFSFGSVIVLPFFICQFGARLPIAGLRLQWAYIFIYKPM